MKNYIVKYTIHNHNRPDEQPIVLFDRIKDATGIMDARFMVEEKVNKDLCKDCGAYFVINEVREEQPFEAIKNWWNKLDLWCSYHEDGIFWFRFFGVGLHFKDITKYDLMFSDRIGKTKYLRIGNYVIKYLKYVQR